MSSTNSGRDTSGQQVYTLLIEMSQWCLGATLHMFGLLPWHIHMCTSSVDDGLPEQIIELRQSSLLLEIERPRH